MESESKTILEEQLLFCLKSQSHELLQATNITDNADLVAEALAESLTKHFELRTDDSGEKAIVLKNLKSSATSTISTTLQKSITHDLERILQQLSEQKDQPKDNTNMPALL